MSDLALAPITRRWIDAANLATIVFVQAAVRAVLDFDPVEVTLELDQAHARLVPARLAHLDDPPARHAVPDHRDMRPSTEDDAHRDRAFLEDHAS